MMKRVLLGAVAVGVILAVYGGAVALAGQKAPEFAMVPYDHPKQKMSWKDFKGKPLLIDFWATWCVPCRQISPRLDRLYADYKDKGLAMAGVTAESRSEVADKAHELTTHHPIFLDDDASTFTAFGVSAIPRCVLIDATGKIVYDDVAFDEPAIEAAIRGTLGLAPLPAKGP